MDIHRKLRVLEQQAKVRVLEQWANCVDGRARQLRVLASTAAKIAGSGTAGEIASMGGYVNCEPTGGELKYKTRDVYRLSNS